MSHRNPDGSPSLWGDDETPRLVKVDAGGTIQERFEQFHKLNPWVYPALVTLARQYLSRGRARVGIAALFERLRWEYDVATTGDPFKLNNDYRSRYVRRMMAQEKDLDGRFEIRRLKS